LVGCYHKLDYIDCLDFVIHSKEKNYMFPHRMVEVQEYHRKIEVLQRIRLVVPSPFQLASRRRFGYLEGRLVLDIGIHRLQRKRYQYYSNT
jgi:hypothetical protein